MPPVGGVIIEGHQPKEGFAVLRCWVHQQLDSQLHPVGTLNQQEPSLKHVVVPPTGQIINKTLWEQASAHQKE